MEYTRLDRLIDVMFTTAKDVESVVENVATAPQEESVDKTNREKGVWDFTETALIDEKRTRILQKMQEVENVKLVKKSRALYRSPDLSVGIACTISKRYTGKSFRYWYAYHRPWQSFLLKCTNGYFVLGCMDLEFAFAIPATVIESRLPELNTTTKDGKTYWHIQIIQSNAEAYSLQCHKTGNHMDLTPYIVAL